MDFLKKVGSTAESLLEQVDQKTAEISKDVRSGNRAARMVAERLEKRERINIEGGVVNADVAKQIEHLQADLDAAGEVLQRSQQLAAEREMKLTHQLERERHDREKREEELLIRIKQLESQEKVADELEMEVQELRADLEEARGSRDHDSADLEALAEKARADAEYARAALAATMKDSEARIAELERTNVELLRELAELRVGGDGTQPVGRSVSIIEEERKKQARELQEVEERLVVSEDKRTALEMQLVAERSRADRLEAEIRKSSEAFIELKEAHAKQVIALETKIASVKHEAEEARSGAEALRRSNMDNGREAIEKRLESLSSHLELKQRQIDSLRSEKRALEQRVNETSALPMIRTPMTVGGSAGEIKGRFVRLKIDPSKFGSLVRILDILDGLTLSAATIMRAQPLARLGFIAYVLLLQMWVFHVISWTSTPQAQTPSSPGSPNNLRGASV